MPGVILDMDGVLVDSYDAHFKSWQQGAAEHGWTMSEAQFLRTFGQTSREIIHAHWGSAALTDEQIAEFDHRKEALYREMITRGEFPAMEGALALVKDLKAAGFKLAIGSSGPPENVELVIDRMGLAAYLDGYITGRDVKHGKPHPEVFSAAAAKIGLPTAQCAVIEDAPVGIAAANAAGAYSIALLSRGHTRETSAAARLIVESLKELSAVRIAGLIADFA